MNWQRITVRQFQQIYAIDSKLDELDKLVKAVCILFNKTEDEVNDLTRDEFTAICKKAAFAFETIPQQPHKDRIGRYKVQYDVRKLRFRRYAEPMQFAANDLIPNLHNILASIVNPTFFGFRLRNRAKDHPKIANELLDAPFLDVYYTCVFFCKLYRSSIEATQPYILKELMTKMTAEESHATLTLLKNTLDGIIPQHKSQTKTT